MFDQVTMKVLRSLLTVACASFVTVSTASADYSLCQQRTGKKLNPSGTQSQRLHITRNKSCPRGYQLLTTFKGLKEFEALALSIYQANATTAVGPKGEPGAQGPQGIQGPQGAKGEKGDVGPQGEGLASFNFVLATQGESDYTCVTTNMADLCGNGDGCRIRFFAQDRILGRTSVFEGLVAVENEELWPNRIDPTPGLGVTVLADGLRVSSVLGVGAETLWEPIKDSVAVYNYRPSFCPGQQGKASLPGTMGAARYDLTFVGKGRFVTRVMVSDR